MSFGGIKEVAKEMGVTDYAVRDWLRGDSTPEVKTIIKIIALSHGTENELNFDIIYKECTRNKIKNK